MAKKKFWMSLRQEQALLAIGKSQGLRAYQHGLRGHTLKSLETMGLVSFRHRCPEEASDPLKRGYFLTSEGFFLFKQLERGKSFHPKKAPSHKKGSVK